MKFIDCHTHCFTDSIAERGLANLANEYCVIPSFNGTVNGLLEMMDSSDIEASVILPVATKPSQVQPINDWVAGIGNPRIIGFGAMHPQFPEPAKELDRMESMDIRGFKIQPNWQNCCPDDPCMFPIYEAAEGRFIITFHAGSELKAFPHELSTPAMIANVIRDFPKLTVIAAHMGGYKMWDEVEEFLLGKRLYLDLSACFQQDISDERLTRMMRAHGIENILFGSDAPCAHPLPQFQRIMSLPLSDEEKEQIARGNAVRLLRG